MQKEFNSETHSINWANDALSKLRKKTPEDIDIKVYEIRESGGRGRLVHRITSKKELYNTKLLQKISNLITDNTTGLKHEVSSVDFKESYLVRLKIVFEELERLAKAGGKEVERLREGK